MRRRLALLALVTLCLGGTTACAGSAATGPDASDGTRSAGESASASETARSEAEPAEDGTADVEAPSTLVRARFCGDVDQRGAADALGIAPARLVLGVDRVPGDKYVPYPGQPKQVSTSWSCFLRTESGDPNAYVGLVLEEEPATARSVSDAQEENEVIYSSGKRAVCTREPAPGWPEGGRVACSRPELSTSNATQTGYALVNYRGLFGDADFRCFVQLGPKNDLAPVLSAAETICEDAVAMVAD